RAIARRAASISRAVIRARLVAFRPNSPKETSAPRCARPALRPLNCLRYLVRFGWSMVAYALRSGLRRSGSFGRCGCRACSRRLGIALGRCRLRDLGLVKHFAFEDPHFHADDSVRGAGLRQAVVDVSTEGVQRNPAFAVPLGAGDFRTVQAARHAHLHTQRATAHRAHHRALHGAAEHHALLDLLRDAVRNQLRIQLRLADLGDVDTYVDDGHAEQLRSLLTQLLDVLALLADHDARTRRLDRDVDFLRRALDLDTAHRSFVQSFRQELTHPEIGVHVQGELLLAGVPARAPVPGNTQPYAKRIYLLTHALILLTVADADGDMTVALDDARATPLGASGEALQLRRFIHMDERHFQLVDVGAVVVLGVRDSGLEHL